MEKCHDMPLTLDSFDSGQNESKNFEACTQILAQTYYGKKWIINRKINLFYNRIEVKGSHLKCYEYIFDLVVMYIFFIDRID